MSQGDVGEPFSINGRQLSGSALKMHVSATDYSVRHGHRRIHPDDYLDLADADADLAVPDLRSVGRRRGWGRRSVNR